MSRGNDPSPSTLSLISELMPVLFCYSTENMRVLHLPADFSLLSKWIKCRFSCDELEFDRECVKSGGVGGV